MHLPEPTLVQRVQDGDPTYYLDLGKHYFYSTLIKNNVQQAFEWIRRAAEQGHPDAQFWVADLYSLGQGTQQSNTNAYDYYTMAALQGCENALIRLRSLYHDEIMIHCPGALNKAEERLIPMKSRGTPDSTKKFYDSRTTHIRPDLVENSLISYFCELFKRCRYADMLNEGNRTKLAFLYHYGYGVAKDVEQAIELYIEAANRGCMDAQYHLAYLYQSEMMEYKKALGWYAAAAHGGHIAAQNHLDYLSWYGFKLDGRFSFDQSKWMDSNVSDILDQSGSDIITERYKSFTSTLYLISSSTREILYTKLKQDISISSKSAILELASQAMDGDKSAIYQIGMNYYHASDGFPCNQYIGCQWIHLAAKLGIDDAQLFIGEIYKQEDPFEQNYFKASLWFNRAKQNKAKFQLGLLYEMGLGVSYSHSKAYKLLTKNVDDDNLFRLGLFYFCNRYRDSVSVFETCAKRGNIEAVDRLRCMYLNGYDHDKNPQMALKLLEYAADRGHTRSQVSLARLYTRRGFAHRDPAKSVEYYFLAAKGGDPHAQYQIAMRYLSGEYVGQNYAKAFELIQASASQGYTLANKILTVPSNINQYIMEPAILSMFLYVMEHDLGHVEYNIGCIYEERGRWQLGSVSARLNITSAIHWFTLSINRNNADAQYRLGLLFEEGKVIEKDLPRASSYYKTAIVSGHCEATFALASMYIDGRGVDQDFIAAYHLFSDAANMGHKEAKYIINLTCYKVKTEYVLYQSQHNAAVMISDTLNMQMVEAVGSQNHAVQYQLGHLFEYREPKRAVYWYEKAGKGGIHDAYFWLGAIYEQGVGNVAQDLPKAAQMYRLCPSHAHSNYRLGQMYQFGRGVQQDYTQAYYFYKKVVEIEDDTRYKILNRTKKDSIKLKSRFEYFSSERLQESISMWEYLAQQGDTQAQYELGYAYHLGSAEPRFPECIKWYSMASAHPDAVQTLGYFYEKGCGFTQDTQKAIRLYEKARKLGNVESAFRLGEVYYNGTGIKQDRLKGISLYIEAARDGSINARNKICYLYLYSIGDISLESKAYKDIYRQSTYDAYRDYVF